MEIKYKPDLFNPQRLVGILTEYPNEYYPNLSKTELIEKMLSEVSDILENNIYPESTLKFYQEVYQILQNEDGNK